MVDMVAYPLERATAYDEKMDLLYPVYFENYLILQRWPEEQSRLTTPIRPFTSTVSKLLKFTQQ